MITQFRFMSRSRLFLTISGVAIVVSIAALLIGGLNLGIDYTSGTLFWLKFERDVMPDEIRQVLADPALADLKLGKGMIQRIGEQQFTLRVPSLQPDQQDRVMDALRAAFGRVSSRGVDQVDPRIGSELTRNALVS
ncbi:MAG: hypothetical protein NUW23_06750, partial [Firmicutes bacterium]|nr:hypothetical protein [Bacillota bacterium]